MNKYGDLLNYYLTTNFLAFRQVRIWVPLPKEQVDWKVKVEYLQTNTTMNSLKIWHTKTTWVIGNIVCQYDENNCECNLFLREVVIERR